MSIQMDSKYEICQSTHTHKLNSIKMKYLTITRKEDYAIVQMDRGKVNALNHDMVEEIRAAFRELEAEVTIRGVIITGKTHFFTAGLDVIELYGYDREKASSFFRAFGLMYEELARFPKPLICALNGYSPAGGTVIAITADYRIMAEGEKYVIGLNEVAVNIQISQNILDGYAYWIGRGLAHRYILEGKLLSVAEAFQSGLVQEVCPAAELLDRAERQMRHYLTANDGILRRTKYKARKHLLATLSDTAEEDFAEILNVWWQPEIRSRMKQFVEGLTKKK